MPDRLRLIPLLLGIALASGCAGPQSILLPNLDSWEQRVAVLSAVEDWDFSGRIAVKTDSDGFNGKLRWQQRDTAYSATVSGPLGIGTVRIEGDGKSVILTDKDGDRTELQDAEQDLRHRYGWTIPIDSLRYWALGIPDPNFPFDSNVDSRGQLVALEQGGWRVTITRYRPGGGQPMPSRLTAQHADARVRLVIDDWAFLP